MSQHTHDDKSIEIADLEPRSADDLVGGARTLALASSSVRVRRGGSDKPAETVTFSFAKVVWS